MFDDRRHFEPTFTISADLDFAFRVDEIGHLDALPEVLVGYRVHHGQMHRQVSVLAGDMSAVFDRVFSDGGAPSFERRCRANLAVHIGLSQLLRGRVGAAVRHLGQSMRWDPRRIVTLPLRAIVRRLGRRLRALFAGASPW